MSQNLRNYTKALYGFDALVRRVPADRWDADSPCEGWCARDVVTHATGVMDAVAQMARIGEIAMPEMPEPDDRPLEMWNTARDNVLEALDHPGVVKRVGNYWLGESTIDDILAFTLWDPLVHSWDVSQAVGLEAHASEELAEASLDVVEPMAEMLRGMALMGKAVEVPADADPMTRLVGLTGRNPSS